jgi:hypothetical protein
MVLSQRSRVITMCQPYNVLTELMEVNTMYGEHNLPDPDNNLPIAGKYPNIFPELERQIRTIKIGFIVWCRFDDQAPEPEGMMFLSYTPELGDGLILSDGKLWEVVEVGSECDVWVKEPGGNY